MAEARVKEKKATTKCGKQYAEITVVVKNKKDDAPIEKATVTVKKHSDKKSEKAGGKVKLSTNAEGTAKFVVRKGHYDAVAKAEGADQTGFEGQSPANPFVVNRQDNFEVVKGKPQTITLKLDPLPVIHLVLNYKDPEGKAHPFPKDFPVQVHVQDTEEPQKLKVLDDTGAITFKVEKDKTFSLSFDSTKTRVFSHDAPSEADKVPTLLEDQTDEQLRALAKDGKLFFSLPKAWKLHQSTWTATDIVVPQDGKITSVEAGIGTAEAPAKLVLEPKLFHARFEFYDRKHWHSDHSDKRVPIPAVVLKGARKSDAAGAPVEPVAGTHDAVASWVVKGDDVAKACQCLPWIVTKKADDGADLPRLDKDTLIEFAWPKGYIHSESATVRKVVELEPDDAKLKPTKTRNVYYDLPKLWKSKCYYTRLAADSAKCFDELSSDEVEQAFDVAKPLVFSLDDVVLTTGTSQALKDKDGTDADKALSKHSRLSVLLFDAEDDFKLKVHDPRAKAPFHSKAMFHEDGAGTYRNAIVDVPAQARSIVFCSVFHDVYDKRTESADFTKGEVLGARAAKAEDTDISIKKIYDNQTDVDNGYVHRVRKFHQHYLHFGGTDGTTVFAALVTYWSGRFFFEDSSAQMPSGYVKDDFFKIEDSTDRGNGSIVDKRNYHEKGMSNAMERWNGKGYLLEEHDDTKDIQIQNYSLFEAKEVEDPVGTFVSRGGKAICEVGICTNKLGSWASGGNSGGTVMRMRNTAFAGEGASRGSDPSTEAREADYDGSTDHERLVIAHELGHAAFGLYDEYVYDVSGYYGLFRYDQYYDGMPYEIDKATMMSSNHAIRMHQFAGKVNWINDEAKSGKTLHKFLGGKQFKLTYAPSGKDKLNYFMADRRIYKPAFSEADVDLGLQGKCNLYLYRLGDDEFNRRLKGAPYKGLLAMTFKIAVTKFKKGLKPTPGAWATATAYDIGACVKKSSKYYGCLEPHTSGTFNTDLGNAKWYELREDKRQYTWGVGHNLTASQAWFKHNDETYFIVKDHKSGSPDLEKQWLEIGTDKGDWAAATAYSKKEQVASDGKTYVCKVGHTSGDAFAGDLATKWQLADSDQGAFAAGTAYAVSDIATISGKKYVCILAHTAETIDADAAVGRLLKTSSKFEGWMSSAKRDWCVGVNKALVKALQGADGKFKLTTTTADNEFATTFLRVFPQWDVPSNGAAAAGTQFEIEVTGDGSDTFNPTGTTIKVGSEIDPKSIVRYLLGKLSDDAGVRSGQDLTAAVTKADLGKLKTWMDGKAGATFTVGDIT